MRSIERLRKAIKGEYFTNSELAFVLDGSENSYRNKASRMANRGEIVRLINGHFVFGKDYSKGSVQPFVIANLLFGPSYVSCETALSSYGLIPETVFEIISVNPFRTTRYKTPIGNFSYRKIPLQAFCVGVASVGEKSKALIATKEKAILDKLYLDCHQNNMFDFLTNSLRIEIEELASLDLEAVSAYSRFYSQGRFQKRVEQLLKHVRQH